MCYYIPRVKVLVINVWLCSDSLPSSLSDSLFSSCLTRKTSYPVKVTVWKSRKTQPLNRYLLGMVPANFQVSLKARKIFGKAMALLRRCGRQSYALLPMLKGSLSSLSAAYLDTLKMVLIMFLDPLWNLLRRWMDQRLRTRWWMQFCLLLLSSFTVLPSWDFTKG